WHGPNTATVTGRSPAELSPGRADPRRGDAMKLRELLRDVKVRERRVDLDADITSVTADSRMVVPGALFVAVPRFKTHGAKFIDAAIRKGAAAIAGESSAATVL